MAKRIVRGLMVAAVALGILAAGTAPIKGPGASGVSASSVSR